MKDAQGQGLLEDCQPESSSVILLSLGTVTLERLLM
jgi:hypothetical protein